MALSFSADPGALAKTDASKRRVVLVTGAGGRIGSYFAEHSKDKYDLRLMVRTVEKGEKIKGFGTICTGTLDDLEQLKSLCKGVDTVVHMAANPSAHAAWTSLLNDNIIGTYNLMVAAKAAGCRRVIYASSIHAVSGYPPDQQVKTSEPVNPGDLYGVTKCFGEALGRYMAEKEGLSVIALRIGAFQPVEAAQRPQSIGMMDAFVSHADLNQLIQKCIDVENLNFAIFNGLSNNRFNRLDITDARELVGYDPQDDFAAENPRLQDFNFWKALSTHSQSDGDESSSGLREELEKLK